MIFQLINLSDRAFQRDLQQLLRLNGKFHRQLVHHFLGIAVDNQSDGILGRNTALVAVEHLYFIDFRSGSFMFHYRRIVLHVDVRERVRTASVAQQQAVALRIVAAVGSVLGNLHRTAVAVLAESCRNTF